MKKIAALLVLFAMVFGCVGCTVTYDYPVRPIIVDGVNISEFTVVYPDSYNEMQRADVQEFADSVLTACGIELNVGTDSETPLSEHEIRIGTVRGADYSSLGALDCRIAVSDGNVILGGNNFYADIRAVYRFMRSVLGFGYDGSYASEFVSVSAQDAIVEWVEPSVTVMAWCTHSSVPFNTEQSVAKAVEAGFNLLDIWACGGQDLHNMLKWAAAYDVKLLFLDWNILSQFDKEDYSALTPEIAEYITAPMVYGNYLVDEPSLNMFASVAEGVRNYESSTGKTAFTNLFPGYASSGQLGCDSYDEYIRSYLDIVDPDMLVVDIYSLEARSTSKYLIENLSLICDILHEENYSDTELGVFIQGLSFAPGATRTPSADDLCWQTYVTLCFGTKMIAYFTYLPVLGESSALIDIDGNTTAVWEGAKDVNADLAAFADVYAEYGSLGVFAYNCELQPWVELHDQIDFSDVMTLEGKGSVLVGCFEKESDGSHAFILSNQKNLLSFKRKDSVSNLIVHLTSGESLTVWQNGVASVLTPDENGEIAISLERGEGVFCVVNGETSVNG